MTIHELWGEEKKKPTRKELRLNYINGSECLVAPFYSAAKKITKIVIEFRGHLARIPSMKNSKLPGKNFPSADVMARVEGMTFLYCKECEDLKIRPDFGTEEVFILLLCGDRGRSFDPDNCMTTVKDWLEPSEKQVGKREKRNRGWGIGLIQNDRQASGMALHAKSMGETGAHTTIMICDWSAAADAVKDLVNELM